MSIQLNIKTDSKKEETQKRKLNFFSKKNAKEILTPQQESRKKKRKLIVLIVLTIIIIIASYLVYRFIQYSEVVGIKISPQDILNPIKKDPTLKKDSSGKYTAALLVGIDSGRSVNDGNMNTDTIILAVYNYASAETSLISIPRDFYSQVPDETWYSKINGIYAIGENREEGSGLPFLKKAVENITGIEVQYYGMVDLKGFTKTIDILGGLTVNVENTFTDYCYPAEADSPNKIFGTCSDSTGWHETITFTQGPQTMDGKTALKFARSRKGTSPEGSDFAIQLYALKKPAKPASFPTPAHAPESFFATQSHDRCNFAVVARPSGKSWTCGTRADGLDW